MKHKVSDGVKHLLKKIAIGTQVYGAYTTINREEDRCVEWLATLGLVTLIELEITRGGNYIVILVDGWEKMIQ